ncbi:MAG TPA: polysaccharide deacetylase family protein [Reyranella sp.]|jgi:peptidoglycan/xylan/chitin deacetylase (PgdA/CDA1 family)|nr:polysaccharide deacetylase family protein [Reyranella sp.]
MKLRHHGRYEYVPLRGRPDYDWPEGKKLAVYLAVNLEHFSFGEGLGAELAPGGPQPDVLNYAWRDYGNRVGAWYLLDVLDSFGLPAAALVNSSMYDYAPELVAAHRERGDEIVGHGRTNAERQGTLDEAAERALIADSTQRVSKEDGRAPEGWLGPWISHSHVTPDLLAEAGYRYLLDWCMDDQPVWFRCRGGKRIMAVPYPQELNDIPAIVGRKTGAAEFADMVVDQFDEMIRLSRERPLVMGIALHAYIIGQPHRLKHLRRALTQIVANRGAVWLTTPGAIARHCAALPAGVVP